MTILQTMIGVSLSPWHSHNHCAVRDIFCNDGTNTDGDIIADGNRSKDGDTGANVAVVANRMLQMARSIFLPISITIPLQLSRLLMKFTLILQYSISRLGIVITPSICLSS